LRINRKEGGEVNCWQNCQWIKWRQQHLSCIKVGANRRTWFDL